MPESQTKDQLVVLSLCVPPLAHHPADESHVAPVSRLPTRSDPTDHASIMLSSMRKEWPSQGKPIPYTFVGPFVSRNEAVTVSQKFFLPSVYYVLWPSGGRRSQIKPKSGATQQQ